MLFDLLKLRRGEAFDVMKYYESAVTVFLVITGGLLKFAFDQNATPPLRRAFEVMGLAMGAMGLLAIGFAERHRRHLKADIAYLANRLSLSIPADPLSVQWYAIVICCSVFVASIVAWSYLIVKHV